jgi:hypothetical protein
MSSIGSFQNQPERFFEYVRKCVETFHFLINKISHQLQKYTRTIHRPFRMLREWLLKGFFFLLKRPDQVRGPTNTGDHFIMVMHCYVQP